MHYLKFTYIGRPLNQTIYAVCLGLLLLGVSSSAGLSAGHVQADTSFHVDSLEVSVHTSQLTEQFVEFDANFITPSEQKTGNPPTLAFWVGFEEKNINEKERNLQDLYGSRILTKALVNSPNNSLGESLPILPTTKDLALILLSTVVLLH